MEKEINKILAIIQARYSSIRLPGKVLKKYKNKTFLEILIKRLKKTKNIDKIVVACSKSVSDDLIFRECKKLNIFCFRGSEKDVLDRFYKVSKIFNYKSIVRITADCPLIDPEVVDEIIQKYLNSKSDYATNTLPPTYPDGLDVEIFSFKILKDTWKKTKGQMNLREHVTTYMRDNLSYKKINLKYKKDYSNLRFTLDDIRDYKFITKILNEFSNIINIRIKDLIRLYNKKSFLFNSKNLSSRNEGQTFSLGQKFWSRAKNVIPGGTMLFSKNPDLFLPKKWPSYFNKSKGCKVWDLENKFYYDISLMGVGTNILGYNYLPVEKKVIQVVKLGNMSTLNSVEEILLAEKLIEMHPWADMARFTRSGGEANAVAVRIARASSGKDNVAICGYHGWHDWYLSANLNNKKNLDNHLMKNLSIDGVPKKLKNTVFSFRYNDFDQLKKIVNNHDIGTIKLEVIRNEEPKDNFLQKVRNLATEKKIILIFDECTSGFRETLGGIHKKYNVNPDIAILGKALGNGYPINAIIGSQNIMESIKSSFVSSTFWTDRIGPTAALETLKSMEKIESWKIITKIGKNIKKKWTQISENNNVKIKIQGIDSLANFYFCSKNHLAYKTFISQEMLKKNFLASNVFYSSIAHSERIMNKYFDHLNTIFEKIKKCENEEMNINKILETDICISGMREKKIK